MRGANRKWQETFDLPLRGENRNPAYSTALSTNIVSIYQVIVTKREGADLRGKVGEKRHFKSTGNNRQCSGKGEEQADLRMVGVCTRMLLAAASQCRESHFAIAVFGSSVQRASTVVAIARTLVELHVRRFTARFTVAMLASCATQSW